MIGYATIKSLEEYHSFRNAHPTWTDDLWRDYFYDRQNIIGLSRHVSKNHKHFTMSPIDNTEDAKDFEHLLSHLSEIDQKLELYRRDDITVIVGYNRRKYVLPVELVECFPLYDYDTINADNLARIGNDDTNSALPALRDESKNSVSDKLKDLNQDIQTLKNESKKVEEGTADELAEIKKRMDKVRAEMEAAQKALMEKLQAKQQAMELKKKRLERDLEILDTQIYGIRCYLGEVIHFHSILTGRKANIQEPVVIYQKIRYLDEEFGKYLAMYNFGDKEMIEGTVISVLKNREDIASLLAPGPKSVSVLKLSRTGTVKGLDNRVKNVLKDYAMYHENQMAVLVRNGENLSIAWLDPERITLTNENLYYQPKSDVPNEAGEETSKKEILSRWFFFHVLQGILDDGTLLEIPEKTSVVKGNSKYISFSMADGWIADNRYGTLEDIVKKSSDILLKKGDVIMTGLRLRSAGSGNTYDNNRGIGERNRTRGAGLPSLSFFPINKVMYSLRVRYTIQSYPVILKIDPKGREWFRHPDGSLSTYKGVNGVFEQYEATCTAIADEENKPEDIQPITTAEKVIAPDTWHSYNPAWTQLTTRDLIGMGHFIEDVPYCIDDRSGTKTKTYFWSDDAGPMQNCNKSLYLDRVVKADIIAQEDPSYYVSVPQKGYGSYANGFQETDWNVNFRVFPDEVINTTFLCSTWIRYVIMSKHVGDFKITGSEMTYSDMLVYLHKLLAYLQKREETEKEMLVWAGGQNFVRSHSDWDVILAKWKIEHGYHSLTETRAKRFVRDISK